jgi:hypothetical protein
MSNSDTVLAIRGAAVAVATPARNILASQSALGTAETLFTMGTDAGTNVTAFLPFVGQTDIVGRSNPLSINAQTAGLLDQYGAKAGERGVGAPYFNSNSFNGLSFTFRVSGLLTSSAASNGLTIKVYVNTKANGPVTGGAGTLATIATAASIGNATSGTFVAEAGGMWDSVSNTMQGTEAWGAAAGVYVARAVGQSTPFTVTAPLSNYIIFASFKFATGAANVCTATEMAYEDR